MSKPEVMRSLAFAWPEGRLGLGGSHESPRPRFLLHFVTANVLTRLRALRFPLACSAAAASPCAGQRIQCPMS